MVEELVMTSSDTSNLPIKEFLERKNYHRIPLSVNSLGHFELEGLVNGTKGNFIVDTGASGTVINVGDIDSFSLMTLSDSEDKAAGLGTTTLHVQKSKGNKIVFNGFEITDWEVGIIDLEHVNHALGDKGAATVNGVIGADIMNTYEAVIDYGEKDLYLRLRPRPAEGRV
jgi:hypothetical protein